MRVLATVAAVCLSGIGMALADPVSATIRKQIDIPAQALEPALNSYSAETGIHIIYISEDVRARRSAGATGRLTPNEALSSILQGTGLTYRFLDATTISIVPAGSGSGALVKPRSGGPTASKAGGGTKEAVSNSSFRLAQVDPGVRAETRAIAPAGASMADRGPPVLQEVIVTAEKRAEPLQEVPVPVTAIDARNLVDSDQLRLEDYYNTVPGLSLSSNNLADYNLSIRGVTTGGLTNPTVGITIDDVPFGSTTALGSRTAAPDLDPSDLKQIEVLRGPQGTLYGASSLGGLLKYVTVDPSTAALTGRLQADFNSVRNAGELGYGVRGAVNLPLQEGLAVRASGFMRRDPGYVDDPTLSAKGVNSARVEGGRVAALWKPAGSWYLKLTGLYQNTSADGASYVAYQPPLADLQQSLLRGAGAYNHRIEAYSATVGGSFAGIRIISITGYGIDTYHGTNDLSGYFGFLTNLVYGVGGVAEYQHAQTKKLSQEVRISGQLSSRVDWLLGGFYTHEDTPSDDLYAAVDVTTLASPGLLYDDSYPTRYAETAGFADLTVHFTRRFDLQLGGRESQNRQRYEETYSQGLFASAPAYNPPEHTRDSSFTYLVTPRYRISSHDGLMVYARLASGYRPGGPNPTCILYPVPCQYAPDKTRNYELGLKGETLQHRLSFDASAYYIDWKDIQLQVAQANGNTYFTNASSAKSQGVELSARLHPLPELTFSGWVAFNDAALTAALPPSSPVVGESGDRLPFSSRFSADFSFQYARPLTANAEGVTGASVSYAGSRNDVFEPAGTSRFVLPAYTQIDLFLGLRSGDWTVNLFANNVGDRRGLLSTGQIGPQTWVANYIRPRTIGLSVAKSFE